MNRYLPEEIVNKICLYISNPHAKLIRDEIKIYKTDHSYYHSKYNGSYYIRHILPFKEYYFDKLTDPSEYVSYEYYYENGERIKPKKCKW